MTRLIYADEAVKRITTEYNKREAYTTGGLKLAWIEQAISGTPTVDAVPVVHGRWDKNTDPYWHICEECGAEVDSSMGTGVYEDGVELHELKYCPVCGARMDAEREEE